MSLLNLSQCGENLSTDLNIHDFGLEFVPLERDLLSLEEGVSTSHSNSQASGSSSNSNSSASTSGSAKGKGSANASGNGSVRGDAGFSKIFKDGDHTILHHSAMALMTLQLVYGLFPRILGKGEVGKVSQGFCGFASKRSRNFQEDGLATFWLISPNSLSILFQRLSDLLLRQRREHLASDPSNPALTNPSSVIDSLIIIDRSVDLATPLCSQLTYEGLIDEVIGIKSGE